MMRDSGLQRTSSLHRSFHLLPQQVVEQKTRKKTKKQKHQRPGPYLVIVLIFLFFFFTKQSWGLPTKPLYSFHITKIIFTSLHQKNNWAVDSSQTSMQWSTSSDCFSHLFKLNRRLMSVCSRKQHHLNFTIQYAWRQTLNTPNKRIFVTECWNSFCGRTREAESGQRYSFATEVFSWCGWNKLWSAVLYVLLPCVDQWFKYWSTYSTFHSVQTHVNAVR